MKPKEYLDAKFSGHKPRKCWICGCVLNRFIASVDHLQPKSKGGKDAPQNYKLACKPCNSARGNSLISKEQRMELLGKPKPRKKDFSALIQAIQLQKK